MNVLDITEKKIGSFLNHQIKGLIPELTGLKLNMKVMTIKQIAESKTQTAVPDFMLVDDILTDRTVSNLHRN